MFKTNIHICVVVRLQIAAWVWEFDAPWVAIKSNKHLGKVGSMQLFCSDVVRRFPSHVCKQPHNGQKTPFDRFYHRMLAVDWFYQFPSKVDLGGEGGRGAGSAAVNSFFFFQC